jgi:hypothetical protein
MRKPLRIAGFITLLLLAALAAIAYDPAPESVAHPGDPARWYKPADTPEKLYHTAMKEAQAALKDAMGDCRMEMSKSNRRTCVEEALRVYHEDVAEAKSELASNR